MTNVLHKFKVNGAKIKREIKTGALKIFVEFFVQNTTNELKNEKTD